jgi:phosphoribosylanthranilate isomerase
VAVEAGADAVGVVVGAPSPRSVSTIRARDLLGSSGVDGVIVTVPRAVDDVVGVAGVVSPEIIQLHGDIGPQFILELVEKLEENGLGGTRVTVSVGVGIEDRPAQTLDRCRSLEKAVDYIHLDSMVKGMQGGTGKTHNWRASAWIGYNVDAKIILAGGLDPTNVSEAIRTVEPFGVDVSSGVESTPGIKDHDKVRSFITAARGHKS